MASSCLAKHLKEKLTSVSHILVLSQEEIIKEHLKHGLIQNVTAEKLVIGALEQTFIEFVGPLMCILVKCQKRPSIILKLIIYLMQWK